MSETGQYNRTNARVSLIKERAFRTPIDTKDAALTKSLAIDIPEEGEVTVLRSVLKREQRWTVGGGRTANVMTELGFDTVDESINFYLQTARLLAAVMGKTVTTGTSYTVPITGTVSSGGGTAILTLSTAMTPDAHIGDMLEITLGDQLGSKYAIIDNDANTVTLDVDTDANIDGDTYEIKTAPFTHVITQAGECEVSTHAMHFDLPNACDPAERILLDMLGIIMKSVELTIEQGGDAIQSVGMLGAKSVAGAAITNPANFLVDFFKWGHVSDFYIQYDSVNVIDKSNCDSIKISIENDSELKHVVGDFHPNYKKLGTIDYTATFHYFPQTKAFFDLRNVPLADYATTISALIDVVYSANRYITFTFNSLMLNEHPTSIPSKDDAILGVDAELKLMPKDNPAGLAEGTLEIEAKDDLGIEYYEGSTLPTPP